MVARTGRSSLRGEARAGGADAGDERGAECAEGPPPPPVKEVPSLAADLTSAQCRGKIGSDVACMVSRLSGHSSRTLHSATPAQNTQTTSRLTPLLRTLSDMGQAATKLGHGGACVAAPKHVPPLPGKSREKISRRCSLSFRTSPATREATGAPVAPHARLARLDRDRTPRRSRARRTPTRLDRGPGSVGVSSRRRRCRTRPFYPGVLSDSIRPN